MAANRIVVDTDWMLSSARRLMAVSDAVSNAAQILESVHTGESWHELRLNISESLSRGRGISAGTAGSAVTSARASLRSYSGIISDLCRNTQAAAGIFQAAENQAYRLAVGNDQGQGNAEAAVARKFGASMAAAVSVEEKGGEGWSTALKFIGKAGQIGGFVSFFGKWIPKLFAGDITGAKSVVDYLKDSNGVLKGISEFVKSNKDLKRLARMKPDQARSVAWKRAFGLNNGKDFHSQASWKSIGLKPSSAWWQHIINAKGWGKRFKTNFEHYTKGGPLSSFTKGGATSAFAWAGLVFTAAGNAFDNYGEYEKGEISKGRAILETVSETGVDIVKNWAIGAAVAAAFGATIGSTPVLLVGAATVGVTMGLDAASKWFTKDVLGMKEGKGLTELVSDFALDVGKAAVQKGKKAVTSAVSNVTNWVQNEKGKSAGQVALDAAKAMGKAAVQAGTRFISSVFAGPAGRARFIADLVFS